MQYISWQQALLLRELACHVGLHSVTCHLAEVPQPVKAGTRGMQGWVDLVALVTYRGGIFAQRWSLIQSRLHIE